MKPRLSNQRCHALTLLEVLVVVVILAILVAMILPALMAHKRYASRVSCAGLAKQIWVSSRVWAGDNRDLFPMQVSMANGGAMELAATGNVVAVFQLMSNELSTPKVLRCPYDEQRHCATNFSSLAATNISYFVGLDTGTSFSGNRIFSGDANLTLLGSPVKSGLLNLPSTAPVEWDASRADEHRYYGNICLADGSVKETTIASRTNLLLSTGLAPSCVSTLTILLRSTGLATNRLAIP